jgi:hypothetical protein
VIEIFHRFLEFPLFRGAAGTRFYDFVDGHLSSLLSLCFRSGQAGSGLGASEFTKKKKKKAGYIRHRRKYRHLRR